MAKALVMYLVDCDSAEAAGKLSVPEGSICSVQFLQTPVEVPLAIEIAQRAMARALQGD